MPSSSGWSTAPATRARGREDGKPYITWITDLARKRNATLVWIDSSSDVIQRHQLAARARSVTTFDYFGHSNRHCFMLDYGNDDHGRLHRLAARERPRRINGSIFDRNAYCKSWGCHTGESMSKVWRRKLGVPLEGAIGKTDYTVVGHGQMPAIVGRWVR